MFVLLYFPGRPMDRHGVGIVRWTIPAVIQYVQIKQKTTTFVVVFCVRVTWFSRQANGSSCRPQVSGGHLQAEKSPDFSVEAFSVRVTYFPRQANVSSRRRNSPVDCSSRCSVYKVLRPQLSLRPLVFALLIFPGSHPPSIVSVHELNFCVRDGNRWTLIAINTNSYGRDSTHRLCQNAHCVLTAWKLYHRQDSLSSNF